MRYILAVLLPPVAVLLTGRPLSAMLNLLLTLLFWIPGAIHACLVVSHDENERRHRETLAALTGKELPPKRSGEWKIIAAGALAFVLLMGTGMVVGTLRGYKSPEEQEVANKDQEKAQAETLPTVEGWTMDEVISKHGEPSTRDKATGWAVWPQFQARFEGGAVVDVVGN